MQEYSLPVQEDLESFDTRLQDYLQADSPLITSLARHLLKSRGKRMRPALLFLSSRAADNFTDFTVDASLAIELIHTATLLHDDVVDESDLRRGQKTINAKWTNLISVLMGDFLFARAFRIMVESESLDLIMAISRSTERVSVGELRQIEEISNYNLTEDEYLDIISHKTASLFAVSCEIGPILNKQGPIERRRFAEFGEKVGMAFQIADDLLDFTGDWVVTGKEPGNDVMNGHVTLLLIYSLSQVSESRAEEVVQYLKQGGDKESFKKILEFINETGGIEYAYKRASDLARQGLEAISGCKPSVYFDTLTDMVEYAVHRAS